MVSRIKAGFTDEIIRHNSMIDTLEMAERMIINIRFAYDENHVQYMVLLGGRGGIMGPQAFTAEYSRNA